MEKICPGVSTTWRLGPGDKLKEFHFCAGTTFEQRQADPKLYFTSKEAVKCPFFGFCQDAINNRKNQDSNQEYMHKAARTRKTTYANTSGAPEGKGNPDKKS